MILLLHCICRQDECEPAQEPGIRLVTGYGLAAAVSEVEVPTATPSVASLLVFERVVEAMHARQTVIPLRHGCLMENEDQIVRLLQERRPEYETLLSRLHGMTEMGIRLLWPAQAVPLPPLPESPGSAYLASLRHRYNSPDTLAPEEGHCADRMAAALAKFSAEERREISPSAQGRLVSMYFLVRKSGAEAFRRQAREIAPPRGVKLLLSGPWPPYSFVVTTGMQTMETIP